MLDPAPTDLMRGTPGTAHGTPMPAAASAGQNTLGELTKGAPDTWPEALRFTTMTAGAIDAATRALHELEERLAHVTGDDAPTPNVAHGYPPPTTAHGHELERTYVAASDLEHRIHRLRARLEV